MSKKGRPINKKVLTERETRENILEYARALKCEQEVIQIFNKYDALLKNCTNEQERKAISMMGVLELNRFISSDPEAISVDGQIVK